MATDYTADANMAAAWLMDDTSTQETDATSNANTMSPTGTPGTYNTTGQYDGAFDFTQQNNAGFSATDQAAIRNIRTLSCGAWIDPDTDGAADGIVGSAIVAKWDGADGWVLGLMSGAGPNNFKIRYQWTGGAGSWRTTTTPVTLGGGSFQHVAITYNAGATTNDPILYYNGVSQSLNEDNTPSLAADDDTGGEPTIGIDGDGTGTGATGEFDGDIDEVFVYNGILTSTQINEIIDNGLDGTHGAAPSANLTRILLKLAQGSVVASKGVSKSASLTNQILRISPRTISVNRFIGSTITNQQVRIIQNSVTCSKSATKSSTLSRSVIVLSAGSVSASRSSGKSTTLTGQNIRVVLASLAVSKQVSKSVSLSTQTLRIVLNAPVVSKQVNKTSTLANSPIRLILNSLSASSSASAGTISVIILLQSQIENQTLKQSRLETQFNGKSEMDKQIQSLSEIDTGILQESQIGE